MEEIQLKDICDLDNGYAFKSDDYIDNSNTLNCRMSNIRPDGSFDILYSAKYLPDDFAEKYKDYILHDGDLIIAMTDMAGDPKILGVPTVVDTQGFCLLLNQRVGRLRFIRDGVNADYLKLALQCPKVRTYLKRFAGGGVQLNVSKKDILSAPVCMRNEEEQNHIAGLFKRVLEVKTKREQELQLLDDLIKARFVELFGNPVLNDKGWEQKSLGEISSKIGSGATPRGGKEAYQEDGITLIRSMNVYNGQFEYKDLAHISDEQAEKLDNVTIEENDVLLNITGASVARSCVVPSEILPARVNQHVCIIRCKDCIIPEFLNKLLIDDNYQYLLWSIAGSGATREAITKQQVENLQIILPPLELQNQFMEFCNQVDKSKVAVQKALDETQLLFDSLMQTYFG